jgi:hypothetical protein
MYLDGDGPSEIAMELPAGTYMGEWLDPRTGSATPVTVFRHAGGARSLKTPEFRNGIALRLTAR